MKIHWLLIGSVLTTIMLSSPAQAGKLESWRFDSDRNQLEIETDNPVQPKAQIIFNPTRLVIDLAGVDFNQRQLKRVVGGSIKNIRLGQFEQGTTRIVVELARGYSLDPKGVNFVRTTSNRWQVQLPEPKRIASSLNDTANNTTLSGASPKNTYNLLAVDSQKLENKKSTIADASNTTQIENIRVTGDGFFLRTISNGKSKIKVKRSRDRKTIDVDISKATLSSSLLQQEMSIRRHGVNSIKFTQLETQPPKVRLTLAVNKDSPDLRVNTSGSRGIIIIPTTRVTGSSDSNSNFNSNSNSTSNSNSGNNSSTTDKSLPDSSLIRGLTTIESVELNLSNSQILIRADKSLSATGGWDTRSGLYRITVNNATLAPKVRGPRFVSGSPVLRVRLQRQDSRTVTIYIQPAAGVSIGQLNQVKNELLALELRRTGSSIIKRPSFPSPRFPRGSINGRSQVPPRPIPRGRLVAIIDPGHGGKDPGAIGIRGLREKDVILPISVRVAQILQRNGVQVLMTRNTDYFVSLQGRVDIAERANADVFISIHANSVGLKRPDVSGLEVYYYNSGYNLAKTVHNSVLRSVNVRDRRVRRARFYVLRKTSMPAILVETGYVTGREDAAKLASPRYREQMAQAIADGILQYLKRK
ncbi:MAG: N-acetylmuramoyl-L-alanine amidase [Cyanobacteria bacterium P01_A01_bin.84]